jgi:hypothetical protein
MLARDCDMVVYRPYRPGVGFGGVFPGLQPGLQPDGLSARNTAGPAAKG